MAEIKSLRIIREKWARVTPQRTEDFKIGVANPRRSWAESATAQKDTWKAGVTQAAATGAYEKGIDAAGDDKWKDRTMNKGPSRFAEGVMIGAPDYEKGVAPYRDVIAATTLPPRMPKGDPRNIERVRTISSALRQAKVGR